MHRRRFTAALGLAAAGCVGPVASPSVDTGDEGAGELLSPDAYDSLAHNRETDLHTLDAGFSQRDAGAYYLGLLTERAHAASLRPRLRNPDAVTFLDETDFSASFVVVFQDASGQSVPDLAVERVRLSPSTVELGVEYPCSGGTSDVTEDTLLVRVQSGDGAPVGATVTLHSSARDPVTVSTVDAASS